MCRQLSGALQASPWQPAQRFGSSSGMCCRSMRDADQLLASEEMSLSMLQQQLEQAVEDEQYELAARLRDVLQ